MQETHDNNQARLTVEREYLSRRCDSSVDFLLPDYMGDVKRMLNYSAIILPSGEYLTDDSVTYAGVVAYSVLYLDGENKLREAGFTSDFELECKLRGEYQSSSIKSDIASLGIRVAGPRKLIAKAAISSDVRIVEYMSIPELEMLPELELHTIRVPIKRRRYTPICEVEYAEDGDVLEGISAEEVEVVAGEARLRPMKCERCDGGIRVEGVMSCRATLCIGGEYYINIQREIPVFATIEDDMECTESEDILPIGCVNSVNVTVVNRAMEDSGQVGAAVVINAVCEYYARVDSVEWLTVADDGYFIGSEGKFEYRDIAVKKHMGSYEVTMTENCDDTVDEAAESYEIVYSTSKLHILEQKPVNDGAIVNCEIEFVTILRNPENGGYQCSKCSHPLCAKIKGDINDKCSLEVSYVLPHPMVSVYGGVIHYEQTVDFTVSATQEHIVKILSSAEPGEKIEKGEKKVVSVYYPISSDTLWDVAKRYKVSAGSIAADNSLDMEVSGSGGLGTLGNVKMLIINN